MQRDELAAWLRLSLVPNLGNVTARKLLAAFGLPQNVFAQEDEALGTLLSEKLLKALRAEPAGFEAQLARTLAWLEEGAEQRDVLTLGDPDYPAGLLNIEDPPLLLYRQGPRVEAPRKALAIVGSRNATAQGLENAERFARSFAEAGVTVVSGMALGIDGAAHAGALEGAPPGQLATIAVVGTGLDRVYPRQHLALAHRIAERGWILSEYPLGTPPIGDNFPRRNRVIAALSQGTLVVEAALQSGSLITARMASEQGKDVFAIPGSIHSTQARGCHALLRQGAKLVESAQDVLEELRLAPRTERVEPPEAPEGESPLLDAMGYDPVGLDALIARTGIPAAQLQASLLELELAGDVARLPGGLFQRRASA
jgi:DNA processing protein